MDYAFLPLYTGPPGGISNRVCPFKVQGHIRKEDYVKVA